MRVLWIVNIEFPEVVGLLTGNGNLTSSGGWLLGASDALLNSSNDIELFVASLSRRVENLTLLQGERIKYYLIPYGRGNIKYNHEYEKHWKKINSDVNPDIVHIHGTEFSHGLSYVRSCGNDNVVVSIQGLISQIAQYYYSGMSVYDVLKNITLRDIVKGTIFSERNSFKNRGENEIKLINAVKHIIGRTSWDKANIWAINPKSKYYKCNETLRNEFYDGSQWDYCNCKKHTIFLSQANYPIKGLHQVLKALPLILKKYPNTIVRIGGRNILDTSIWKESGYQKIIRKLLTKYNLIERITFLGNLNAREIMREYLQANVFVCPSSIENSPNSLGEAQILGVPCVAAYVGGIPDMMLEDEGNMYRFEEFRMLAQKVCDIFDQEDKFVSRTKKIALDRHDSIKNARNLVKIYDKVKFM